MVGQNVTIYGVSDKLTDTGELYANYTYDFESGATIFASLYITQNALIPEAEMKRGHDASWAFEESKQLIPIETVELPGMGKALKAFYNKNNMEVSFLFQDYYVLVAFIMDADDAATLAVNKTIASHVISEISMADVSLTGDD